MRWQDTKLHLDENREEEEESLGVFAFQHQGQRFRGSNGAFKHYWEISDFIKTGGKNDLKAESLC